jgi:integrase
MKTVIFTSVFADSLNQFVAFKRTAAMAYEKGVNDLASFDRFAREAALPEPVITMVLAGRYRDSMAHLTPKTRYDRMCVLRQFSAFHHLRHPHSEILLELGVKKQPRIRFRVLSSSDVAELMRATDTLDAIRGYAQAMKCLIGLLYCGALRIGEALALNVEEFDAPKATLLVRCGKFRKQRYIPLAPSTQAAIANYLASRHLPSRIDAHTPLLADQNHRRLTYHQVRCAFTRLLNRTGLRDRYGPVRLHDLRHSFATTVLRQVVHAGGDGYAILPKLATFMGHVSFASTQVYLHADPGCLALASARFHHAFFNPAQPSTKGDRSHDHL